MASSHDHHILANAALAPYEQPLGSQNRENLSAQPSVTSIHQVWTSASSNSADEFSPEMIGKLRKGLPFLAAYAVRPRLVGMSSLESPLVSSPLIGGSTVRFVDKTYLSEPLVGSSTSARALKKMNKNSNNFDELKVETSSTSRAEHKHNQKTILKKYKKNQRNRTAIKKRKSNLGTAVANRFKPNQSKRQKKSNKKQHKHIPTKLISSRVGYFKDHKHPVSGRQSHRRASTSRRAVNWLKTKRIKNKLARQKEGQVKGGTKEDSRSRKDHPFYATRSGDNANKDVDNLNAKDEDDIKTALRGQKDVEGNDYNSDHEDDNNIGDQDTADGEKSGTLPTRPRGKDNADDQGTDYVDEEDETVTIMPKFDGVDDNPDPNEYSDGKIDNFENSGVDEQGVSSYNNNDDDAPEIVTENYGNDRDSAGSEDVNENGGVDNAENSDDSNNGATNSNESGSKGHSIVDDGDQGIHNSFDRKHNSSEKTVPGVEFADDQGSDQGMRKDINSLNEVRPLDDSNEHDGNSIDNLKPDEMGPSKRNSTISDVEESNHSPQDDSQNQPKSNSNDDDDDAVSKRTDNSTKSVLDSEEETIEEKHNMDHEIDCENHDHHHDSMKWLQDAIKGEPEVDYPIMSKPLNNTSFSCKDQQYPGYYADVESRCQVSIYSNCVLIYS